jgi:CheY-like chemotaxis protein
MEGLGTLAGGIAHDFNNILAIILGYTNRLESFGSKPETTAATKIIKEAVERGAALVQQLLTSARQTEARFSALDLNALVRELENMLQATFPKMINFELQLQPDLPLINADRSQIFHQVLLNLCVNARDAMKDGGTLTLETSMTPGAELTESFTGATAQNYACIRVRDTGSGMSKGVKSHIFEPFFTTKERGKGTGLGLSVVYGVVNNHRGFVQVESEPEAGTTFIVYLPVEHAIEETGGGSTGRIPRKQSAPQTILLVEDEEMLRDLGVTILEGEGYRVLAAKDGMEAVALFEEHRDDIGLVVCDLGLPRLGGREAFLKMKESRPGVRAIIASGYLEPAIRSEMLKAGVLDTIQKPYDFNDLLTKIRSAIGPEDDDDHPKLF